MDSYVTAAYDQGVTENPVNVSMDNVSSNNIATIWTNVNNKHLSNSN